MTTIALENNSGVEVCSKGLTGITPSYHDVDVYLDGIKHNMFEASYGLFLCCTRAAGWQVWHRWGGEEKLLAGEYEPKCHLRVVIKGSCVVDNIKVCDKSKNIKQNSNKIL